MVFCKRYVVCANYYTVISAGDVAIRDVYISRRIYMNAIVVGELNVCFYFDSVKPHIVAVAYPV